MRTKLPASRLNCQERAHRWQALAVLGLVVFAFTVNGFSQKPQAQLPNVYVDTTYNLPTGGTTWAAHTAAQLQSALKSAQPGDVIVLDAGVTYVGNFMLPAKSNPNRKWIYIISSQLGYLPAGTRVSPASVPDMATVVTPNTSPAFSVAWGANYWRFAGIEMYQNSNYPSGCGVTGQPNCLTYQLLSTPWSPSYSVPDHIFVDRCYVHGDATHDIQVALQANFTYFALIDSYVSAVHGHMIDNVAVGAFNSTGPFKINNNYLEAAGENIMFGGSGGNANIGVPSDIEIQNNYIFKPLSWIPLSLSSYQLQPNSMVVKNAFELKSAQRVLFNGNTIENVWAGGQLGYAVVLTVRTTQSGDFAVVNDVTITNNWVKNVVSFVNTLAADDMCNYNGQYTGCHNAGSQDRWNISNNLVTFFDPIAPGGSRNNAIGYQPGYDHINNHVGQLRDVVFQHNTTISNNTQPCWAAAYFGTATLNAPPSNGMTYNIWILDNVLCKQTYGPWGYGLGPLTAYMGQPNTPPYDVTTRYYGNVMWKQSDAIYTWPAQNTVPAAVTYINPPTDYTLLSPNWRDATDGTLAGVDVTKLP